MVIAAIFLMWSVLGALQASEKRAPLDPAGIRGALVLCGGGKIPDAVRDEFVRLAGGMEARLVVIPTASDDDTVAADAAAVVEIWKSHGIGNASWLHTRSREEADDPEFVAPLTSATAVWITGGRQTQIAAAYSGTLVETELKRLIDRGGVVGGTSAGAACQSKVMLVRGDVYKTPGFGLLPGAIIDQHFLVRDRKSRLIAALGLHPEFVGLGVDEQTALIVEGRSLRCVGESTVTICYAPSECCTDVPTVLHPGDKSDLTMLCRAAWTRRQPAFPAAQLSPCEVPQGALVIAGGGGLPEEVIEKFVELAGGPESPIVVLPTANPDPLPETPPEQKLFERAGAKNLHVLKERGRAAVESPQFLETLRQAKGVWFGGGRQWRFVDAYEGTAALEAIRDVLRRGGVIGGSSAGATIQGEYLVRGSPLGNELVSCSGYERGFAFLPGTAIDQHFTQRKRFADMTRLMETHPQLLGVGIDEGTALIVQGCTAEVLGKGEVHFYNRKRAAENDDGPDYESLASGAKYDLLKRSAVLRHFPPKGGE